MPIAASTTRTAIALTAHGGPEVMALVEEPVPSPAPGEVLVDVEAIGVNFGDVLVRRGAYAPGAPLSVRPGFELAGTVRERRREGPAPGTAVAAFTDSGGYASVACVPADRVFPLPDGMSPRDAAALLIQGVTAQLAVHRVGRVGAGDRVLVHAAAGGVGSIAIQLLTALGAEAIGVASSEEKRARARALGAVAAIAADPATLRDDVRAVTGGAGVDVVLDSVGGPLFRPSLSALGAGGRYVVVGAASGEPSTLDARRLMPRSQTLSGFVLASVHEVDPTALAGAFAAIWELVRRGELTIASRTMALADAAAAHRLIERRALTGKLVLVP